MYVRSIRFENLKSFESLNFDLIRPDQSYAGWTVFVGGNSSGKSTLLKGIALALLGPEAGRQLSGTTNGWITKGERKAIVSVDVTAVSELDLFKSSGRTAEQFKAAVRWTRATEEDTPEFRAVEERNKRGTRIQTAERGLWDANSSGWFSAGYGPMRRLSGSSSESIRYAVGGGTVSRYVTLFREDAALSESEEWLKKTHSRSLESKKSDWDLLLKGVVDLLSDGLLPHGMRISRITVDNVFVEDDRGLELPMRDISDGCRGVYATVLDLIHGMHEVYRSASDLFTKNREGRTVVNRPGVVLIDEVEAHLHPSWQREIPEWLKTHFPLVQFLVSTHSPFVAQAADPNGVFVLPLQNESDRRPRALSEEEYKKLRWASAQRTLLGSAFGVPSTRSRWADRQIRHFQTLDAKAKAGAHLTPTENNERTSLEKQLELIFEDGPDEPINGIPQSRNRAS